jgi:hypothetical protein
MHEIATPIPGIHTVQHQAIFFVGVRSTDTRQRGKSAGLADKNLHVAIENELADRDVVERRIGNIRARTFEHDPADGAIAKKIGHWLQLFLPDKRLQVEAECPLPDIDVMNDAVERCGAPGGIRCHAGVEQLDDRRTLIFGGVGVARGSDKVDENEIDIGRCQHMSDIVVRPDFPAIRDFSVESEEIVKQLAHMRGDAPRLLGFQIGGKS